MRTRPHRIPARIPARIPHRIPARIPALALALGTTLAAGPLLVPTGSALEAQEREETQEAGAAEATADTTDREGPDEDGIELYEEVVTEEAVTDSGLFVTHRVEEKLLYEIPRSELARPHLWVTRIARAQHGTGYGGQKTGSRVVRWEWREGEKTVLLRSVSYEVVADSTEPIHRAVRAATFEPVIKAFEAKAFSPAPDSAIVIDVTDLFTSDVPEFSPRERLDATSLDGSRSFLEEVLAFPENIEVEALLTFSAGPSNNDGPSPFGPGGTSEKSISVVMHHSMVRLPEDPMRPRFADDRVGYFEVDRFDYGEPEHRAPRERLINRWRLECPERESRPCEPVDPIVFYVDPATPEAWRPWIARGIESWQVAFEEAGFRNAILAGDPPTREEDPEWHPEDARYSVIRWLPSPIENASGPHVHDPRTGEILEADIQFYHNVMNLLRSWYFVQVSPLDERARDLPLPDSLMGRLVEYVAAHEVGHSLGLPHNMKASSSYPVDSLRSASFTARYGNEASIMDYGRFNYVAQPGDGARLIPIVGPYDRFAIRWGYRPIPEAETPEEEKETLDRWAREQDDDPMLRFGSADGIDPSAQTEDLGDDPVRATELGLRNLERVVPLLLEATGEEGESYEDLEQMYARLVNQWRREMRHVATVIGGVYEERKHFGQEGVVHEPVPRERQREALRFLQEHAFRVPSFLVAPELTRRFEPTGTADRVASAQTGLLGRLLSDDRIRRLQEEATVRSGGDPYPPANFLADLRDGLWEELEGRGSFTVGPYRRILQREHVEILAGKLDATSEIRMLARGELRTLANRIGASVSRAGDRETRLHLQDLQDRIDGALDPR